MKLQLALKDALTEFKKQYRAPVAASPVANTPALAGAEV